MQYCWSEQVDAILKAGHSLKDAGINNWALSKDQALDALNQFLALNIPVLGGDVYEQKDELIQSNYDSWYCDPIEGENEIGFLNRSISKAREYITDYNSQFNNTFFVLVPKIDGPM